MRSWKHASRQRRLLQRVPIGRGWWGFGVCLLGDQLSTSCSAGYDYGYFGIGVTGWGSTPYNVAVGGTDFEDTYNSSKARIPIGTYWNSTNYFDRWKCEVVHPRDSLERLLRELALQRLLRIRKHLWLRRFLQQFYGHQWQRLP